MDLSCYLGIDWGGTSISALLVDTHRDIIWRDRIESHSHNGYEGELRRILNLISDAENFADSRGKTLTAIGCGVAAYVRHTDGYISGTPNLGFDSAALGSDISGNTGIPIIIENDVNAAAFCEYEMDENDGDPFLAIFVGTGVGAGIIIDGEIYSGASGFACEIGHIPIEQSGAVCGCGGRGCVEAYAGGAAIKRRITALLKSNRAPVLAEFIANGELPVLSTIGKAAQIGDAECLRLLDETTTALGTAIATAANLFNPATIVLGGGVIEGYPKLADKAWRAATTRIISVTLPYIKMRRAKYGADAVALGAVFLAQRSTNNNQQND